MLETSRGFLTTPGKTPKIETLQQLLDSGIPYYWHDHGSKAFYDNHPNSTVREASRNGLQYQGLNAKKMAELVIIIKRARVFSSGGGTFYPPG